MCIKGGQGRDEAETSISAFAFIACVIAAVVILISFMR
jgi:hypothetical protein